MDWTTIISIIVGGLGAGLGTWLLSLWKEKHAQSISNNDQAIAIYKELVNTLNSKLKEVEERNQEIENNYIETREENARLKTLLELQNNKD